MVALKNLGFFSIRWFILGDGLTFGTGNHQPHPDTNSSRIGQWRFDDPPYLKYYSDTEDYSLILIDFEWVLNMLTRKALKLVPSLIDFHWCLPGKESETEGFH